MDRQRFLELVEPIIQLLEKKHQDYNTGVKLEDYFPFGPQSYAQMIHVKTLRLISLYQNNRPVNFESAEDTVKDLINYTVFFLDYLEKAKNEQV